MRKAMAGFGKGRSLLFAWLMLAAVYVAGYRLLWHDRAYAIGANSIGALYAMVAAMALALLSPPLALPWFTARWLVRRRR